MGEKEDILPVEIARCKFQVISVTDYGPNCSKKIRLETRYDSELAKEDRAFRKATPTGSMEVDIDNPNVFDIFSPGNYVYIDVQIVK